MADEHREELLRPTDQGAKVPISQDGKRRGRGGKKNTAKGAKCWGGQQKEKLMDRKSHQATSGWGEATQKKAKKRMSKRYLLHGEGGMYSHGLRKSTLTLRYLFLKKRGRGRRGKRGGKHTRIHSFEKWELIWKNLVNGVRSRIRYPRKKRKKSNISQTKTRESKVGGGKWGRSWEKGMRTKDDTWIKCGQKRGRAVLQWGGNRQGKTKRHRPLG